MEKREGDKKQEKNSIESKRLVKVTWGCPTKIAAEKKLLYQKEKCMKMDAATAYYYGPEFYLEN